ncbi:MAG: hypothetical protein J6P03_01145 [Opitutales bacterium]|nr:hypothetical protein [Opitutales bacterium]
MFKHFLPARAAIILWEKRDRKKDQDAVALALPKIGTFCLTSFLCAFAMFCSNMRQLQRAKKINAPKRANFGFLFLDYFLLAGVGRLYFFSGGLGV